MTIPHWMIAALTVFFITVGSAASEDSDNLSILSRSGWGAKEPIKKMVPHTPIRITVHHTATRQRPTRSLKDKMQALQQFSQSAGKLADGRRKQIWADVPYHFYVSATGEIAEGRAVHFPGDTNTNYDPNGHISIVLEGNFNEEIPGQNQISALVKLIVLLVNRYKIGIDAIGDHRQYVSTACPGHNLHAMMAQIKADVAKRQK